MLQHVNGRSNVAKPVKTYLETLKWEVTHPTYSPDIAPSGYHLFQSMAHGLAYQHLRSYEEVKKIDWFMDRLKRRIVCSRWYPKIARKMEKSSG